MAERVSRKAYELLTLVSPRPAALDDLAFDLRVTRSTVLFLVHRAAPALGVSLKHDRDAQTVCCEPASWARCQEVAEEYLRERGE